MTAALERGEWSAARPGRTLPPGKTRHTFYRRLGGPQGRCGRVANLVPTGIRSRTLQLIVSRYTDWASRPIYYIYIYIYILYIYIYIYIYILCINYRKDQKCMTFPQCQAFLISLEIPLFHKAVDPESNCCQHGYAIDIHPLSSETKTHPSVSPPSPGLRIWLSLTVVYFNSSQSYTT